MAYRGSGGAEFGPEKTDRTGPRGDVADGVVRLESNIRWRECSKKVRIIGVGK